MSVEEFNEILNKSLSIVYVGIEKGYFKQENKDILVNKLLEVIKNGVGREISGTAIYGVYSSTQKRLYYNVKVFKDEKEALIYILHEMKHALDDNELGIGFDLKSEEKGVGMNEGATQRFATDIAEEILGEKNPETMQSSLGITLSTNLDEYQIEDKMNELFCKAQGISRAEFFRIQNDNNLDAMGTLKQRFNKFADFDAFEKALDGIYAIQEETWIDENGNLLEKEAEPTPEQTERAKELVRQCQSQILQFIERSNPERLEEIKEEIIMIDGEIMNEQEMLYQYDYLTYQDFITKGLDLDDYNLVYISGLGGFPFEEIYDGETSMKQLLESSKEPFTETIYLRQGDEYKMATVTFDKTGVVGMSEMQTVTSFDNILEGIKHSDIIGNAEEYIRILKLQGNDIEAQKVQKKYEYFMNNRNRIPEMKQHINERTVDPEFEEIMRIIADGEEFIPGGADVLNIEPDEGKISYNGITIFSDGTELDQFGGIMMQVPDEVIESIELAVEQGELVLTEAQRRTLLEAKQKPQDKEVSEQDFKEVAENSIEEKDVAFNALKLASQEPEKDNNIQSQGE